MASRTVEGAVDLAWWKSFRDNQLSSLVERLVAQNLDLKTAAERVIQSVAQRRVAASQGLPHVGAQSSSVYKQVSLNGEVSLFEPVPGAGRDYGLFQDGFTSSWQLDLFGRVRRAVEAADANTLAAVENRHGVALTAVAELAQSYMQLRGTQNRLAIAKTQSAPRRRECGACEHTFPQWSGHDARLGASEGPAGHHRRNLAAAAHPGGGAHQRHRTAAGR